MVNHDRNDRRQRLVRLLAMEVLPDPPDVEVELQGRVRIGPALVLDQQVEERLPPLDLHRVHEIAECFAQLRVDEAPGTQLQRVPVDTADDLVREDVHQLSGRVFGLGEDALEQGVVRVRHAACALALRWHGAAIRSASFEKKKPSRAPASRTPVRLDRVDENLHELGSSVGEAEAIRAVIGIVGTDATHGPGPDFELDPVMSEDPAELDGKPVSHIHVRQDAITPDSSRRTAGIDAHSASRPGSHRKDSTRTSRSPS